VPSRILVALLAATLAASASPPSVKGFMRMDRLAAAIGERITQLREKEEFEAKPREERLVVLFRKRVETYEKKALTGAYVVEEVFDWDAVRGAKPTADADRTVGLLAMALGERFGPTVKLKSRAEQRERYATGKELVDLLNHDRLYVRMAAFACLRQMYGRTHDYRPDAPERERRKAQRHWRSEIR